MNPLPAEFFTRFGLYAEREFLTPEECASLRDEMRAATGAPATVADGQAGCRRRDVSQDEASGGFPDNRGADQARSCSKLSPDSRNTSNGGSSACRHRSFCVYREGDFFRPHEDDSKKPDAPDFVRQRSVSAVVFLNGATPGDPAGYSGGSLTFFGLMDDSPSGESVGLPLAGETGLLIAFPSHLVHSVSPVTAGERYTLVSWFFEDPSLSVSERSETMSAAPG